MSRSLLQLVARPRFYCVGGAVIVFVTILQVFKIAVFCSSVYIFAKILKAFSSWKRLLGISSVALMFKGALGTEVFLVFL